jgi:tRNA(Arg) A34 adenosine deaminase TadA
LRQENCAGKTYFCQKTKMNDRDFLRMAITLARQGMNNNEGGPFGALVVKNGQIIGQGNNRVTSSNDPTAHAEVVAIRDACQNLGHFQLDDCVLYTSCEPCPMCLGAIYWARPDRIVFAASREDAADAGFDDNFIYEEIKLSPAERSISASQDLAGEANRVFEEWKEKMDRREY